MEDSNFKSTKFVLAVLVVLISSILLFASKITFDQFKDLMTPIIGFYFAANVASKIANSLSGIKN